MTAKTLDTLLAHELAALELEGRLKGREQIFTGVLPPAAPYGPRYMIAGHGGKPFLRMNSNNYLGLAMSRAVIEAEHQAVEEMGAGPGAVRFISGTWATHVALEDRLAAFHGREAAVLFSSAYAAVMGTLPRMVTSDTAVISDALNHNCIINAIRLAQPKEKYVFRHLDLGEMEAHLKTAAKSCRRALVVTDGVFSMRGDHAELDEIMEIARERDADFPEGVLVMVDDSHGVGAIGAGGRGTEELTRAPRADILVATLGKALGVNGGYVAASTTVARYLRETSPFYIYSNPISPGEAAAAAKALEILAGDEGQGLLAHLRAMAARLRDGLQALRLDTIAGAHPICPLILRNGARTTHLAAGLMERGILATAINYPVVPRGEEEIRFQVSADHTEADIDEVLAALAELK